MNKKHLLVPGFVLASALLLTAVMQYPGGSQRDLHSLGFSWMDNYLCNLFGAKAMNGADNSARGWAVIGWFFMCCSLALFFIEFSKKISSHLAAGIVKYCGIASMVAAFLAVTPYHDAMITISITLALISMFYITVFIFRSRLTGLKILSAICIIVCYVVVYMYYTSSYLELLPVMQKVSMLLIVVWMLCLHYGVDGEHFQFVRDKSQQ